MRRTAASAQRNMVRAIAQGHIPSLADHIAAGTLDDLTGEAEDSPDAAAPQEEVPAAAPEPTVEPTTTRPQPPPAPPAPAAPQAPLEADPAAPPPGPNPLEGVLATRARLMNPRMPEAQAIRVARKALGYLDGSAQVR